MGVKKGINYTSDEVLKDIYNCAKEVYGGGIVVPSETHPCGWAWVSFSYIDTDEGDNILIHTFDSGELNCGFGEEDYEGLTLKEILIKTNGKFLFEINRDIDWE